VQSGPLTDPADTEAMKRRHRWAANDCSGATLIDLMLVVTILGIVTAVAVQTFDTDEMAVDALARQIVADIYRSQSLAIRTNTGVGVAFDKTANTSKFVLADGSDPATQEATLKARPEADAAAVDELVAARSIGNKAYDDGRITAVDFGGASKVVFAADGRAAAPGYVQVVQGDAWLRVRVDDVTGRVTITGP